MSDPSASSSDKGFLPFRAATALSDARVETEGGDAGNRSPPPLPPPPPGVEPRLVGGTSPSTAERPPPPLLPKDGSSRTEAWLALVDWCVRAGVAQGGLLARRDGTVVESGGASPTADTGLLARRLCTALAAAREAAAGEPAAAALDLGGAWITGFAVSGPGGSELVAGIWGRAPLRRVIREPLARWLGEALARTGPA